MDYSETNSETWKSVKVARPLHKRIKVEAARHGITMTELVEHIFTEYLRRRTHADREDDQSHAHGAAAKGKK